MKNTYERALWDYGVVSVIVVALAIVFWVTSGPSYTPVQQLAIRADAALDRLTPPPYDPAALVRDWPAEIAPFFEYEGFGVDDFVPPMVTYEAQIDGMNHNHLLGYTYCDDVVFINQRVRNPVSAWYGVSRAPLATLVHEMIHTLGGDFCVPFDSETSEPATQTATLETLAAMANGGNYAAQYALLQELKGTAEDVVLADALKRGDLDSYRKFARELGSSAIEQARFEKSMRFWASNMDYLREILDKYSVLVFKNVQAGKVFLDLPGGGFEQETLKLDDLSYFLGHLEEMTEDAPSAPSEEAR